MPGLLPHLPLRGRRAPPGARDAGEDDAPSFAHLSVQVCPRALRAGWVRASALGSWGLLAPRPLGDFLHVKKVTKVPLKGRPQGLPLRISFPLRSCTETRARAARPTASPLPSVGAFDGRIFWLRWRGRDALGAVPRPGIAFLCRLRFGGSCTVSAGEAWVRCTKRLSGHTSTICVLAGRGWFRQAGHTCTVCVLAVRVCC